MGKPITGPELSKQIVALYEKGLGAVEVDETVHHKDKDHANNSEDNLQLRLGQHGNGGAYKCRCCGSIDIVPVELEGA